MRLPISRLAAQRTLAAQMIMGGPQGGSIGVSQDPGSFSFVSNFTGNLAGVLTQYLFSHQLALNFTSAGGPGCGNGTCENASSIEIENHTSGASVTTDVSPTWSADAPAAVAS